MLKVPRLGKDDLVVDFSSNDTRDLALRVGGAIAISLPASALRIFRIDPQPAPGLRAFRPPTGTLRKLAR